MLFSLAACSNDNSTQQTVSGSYCVECGGEISSTDKFCGSCGSPTNSESSSDVTNNNNINSNVSSSTINATHIHSYSAATCTSPAKCSCGVTSGRALGHNYSNATCTTPGKCYTCGATGSVSGHNYNNATCVLAKKCATCGITEGEPLGCTTDYAICQRCGRSLFFTQEYSFQLDSNRNVINGPSSYTGLSFPKGKYEVRIYRQSGGEVSECEIMLPFGMYGVKDRETFVQIFEVKKPFTGSLFPFRSKNDKWNIKITAVG